MTGLLTSGHSWTCTATSLKIVLANTLMELCDRIPGADVDAVTESLAQATDRIVSPKYLTAGMGDGGACHPRDGIAMSWLAQHLDLSVDLFGYTSWARRRRPAGWPDRWAITTWPTRLSRSCCWARHTNRSRT